tara:strand:+ start:5722 stop:5991 length:270 start_codon:yes stop_codon:yes gene_type:complete
MLIHLPEQKPMTQPSGDELSLMLKDGWTIKGYSVCMMVHGALSHNILLQNEDRVKAMTIVTERDNEVGRNRHTFAPSPPAPAKKKGFFS